MATQKQIEANRNNAQKSTGPRTDHGKARSRCNALKHGLAAEALAIIPGEDPDALASRIDGWLRDLGARDEVEGAIIRRAALLSWKLDRGDRHEAAVLGRRVREQAEIDRARHRERVRDSHAKLLPAPDEVRAADGLDPTPAAELVGAVETTAEGCGWLLGCWERIRAAADGRIAWTHAEEMGVVRLLGHGPAAVADAGVLDLVVAGRVLMARPGAALDADRWEPGPFGLDLDGEALRAACGRRPSSREEASRILAAAAARATSRLEVIRDLRAREGDAWGEAESAAVASFDAGDEGERLRRYQSATHREMIRALESVSKLRLQSARLAKEDWPVAALRNEADPAGLRGAATTSASGAVADPTPPRNEPNPGGMAEVRNEANPEGLAAPRNEADPGAMAGSADLDAPSPRGSAPVESGTCSRNEPIFDFDDLADVEWIDIPGFGEAIGAPSLLGMP